MRIQLLILLAVSAILQSCYTPRYVYAPSPPNNPFFKEQGESKFAAYYSTGLFDDGETLKNRGLDIQGAYAIGENWALTANFSNRNERDIYSSKNSSIFDSSVVKYKRKMVEFGGGYFLPVNRMRTITLNLYAGVGFGKYNIDDRGIDEPGQPYSRFHDTKVFKFYAQPSLNIMHGYFNMSLLGRLSFVKFNGISTSYTNDELEYFRMDNLPRKTLVFWEPTGIMRFTIPGCDWLSIEGGGTLTAKLYNEDWYGTPRSSSVFLGLNFDFFKMAAK